MSGSSLGELQRILSEWCHVVNERDASPKSWRSLKKAWEGAGKGLPEYPLPRKIPAGTVLIDRYDGHSYTVEKRLGVGGNGSVYACQAEGIGQVAVKFPIAWRKFPSFAYEARGVVQRKVPFTCRHYYLDHVAIEGVWGRFPVIVMELVSGGSLDEHLQAHFRKYARGFDTQQCARYLHAVCASLLALGLVHNDIKPENVLIDEHGQPKITDFGLALPVDVKLRRPLGYDVLKQAGTPGYMSPEQVVQSAQVTVRSDIYALGVMGYVLHMGRKPVAFIRGEDPREYMARAVREPIDFSVISCPHYRAIIERCIQISLVSRYPDLPALMHALEPIKSGVLVSA